MEVSNQHVHYNRPCLEACLRRLRYLIEDLQEARLVVGFCDSIVSTHCDEFARTRLTTFFQSNRFIIAVGTPSMV